MVNDGTEIALQGVEGHRALAVLLNAVIDIGYRCLDGPVRDLCDRVVGDLAHHLRLEGAAVAQDPVVIAS